MDDTVGISTIEDIVAEIIKNADYETLLRLNQVGKQYIRILNDPFILSYLADKWLNKSHASEVKNFNNLVDFRESYYFTPRCLKYKSMPDCLKLSAKDGNLPFIRENLKFIDNELVDTLIVIAMENDNTDILDFLLPRINNVRYITQQAAKKGDMTTLLKLEKKYYLDYNSALWGAAEGDNVEIIKYAITRGAKGVENAFLEAVSHNALNVVEYLLENYRDEIDIMGYSTFSETAEMVELLSSYAPINVDYLWPLVYHNRADDIVLWLFKKRLITKEEIYKVMIGSPNFDLLKILFDLKIYPPDHLITDIVRQLFEENQFDLILTLLSNITFALNLTDITGEYLKLDREKEEFLTQLLNPNDCYITVTESDKYSKTYLINNYKFGANIIHTQYFDYPTYVDSLISLMYFDK
jgi:hypothetical protein